MGRHPDLPDVKPYKLYVINKNHVYKDVVIDHIEFNLALECRNCGDRGPERIIIAPNPWDGLQVRWYHMGCDGCKLHAFDIYIDEKEAWALPYQSHHLVRAKITDEETTTRTRH